MENNQNAWNFKTSELTPEKYQEKVQRDRRLYDKVITESDVLRLGNICFNSCVNNFTKNTLSKDESECIHSCKAEAMSFIFNNTNL